MSVVSKLPFIPFIPSSNDTKSIVYQSYRDKFRGEIRDGLDTLLAQITGIPDIHMYYSEYARIVVYCLGVLLDGWPAHIPFANLSDIKGGVVPLRFLRDLLRDGTLKFIPAPPDVRQRALHDPESVLPHVMAAAKLPPRPLTTQVLKFSPDRFRDLTAPHGTVAPLSRRQTTSHRAQPCAPAEERVLHPYTLEPILTQPIGPGSSSRQHRERRQRCDVNKARHRPVSNPHRKPSRYRKVGALTSHFALDRPTGSGVPSTSSGKVMKPLSEHRMPVLVNDDLGGYVFAGRVDAGVEDIESFSDPEESDSDAREDGQRRSKRRRCL